MEIQSTTTYHLIIQGSHLELVSLYRFLRDRFCATLKVILNVRQFEMLVLQVESLLQIELQM